MDVGREPWHGAAEESEAEKVRMRAVKDIFEGAAENLAEENAEQAQHLEKQEEAIENLVDDNRELEAISERDKLTGVLNRRGLENQVKRLLSRIRREGGALTHIAVLILDADNFKKINDTHGHDVGDRVLKSIAESLENKLLLGHPLREDDIVARYGGEEFVVILPGIAQEKVEEYLSVYNERSFKSLAVEVPLEGKSILVTLSGGLTEYRYGEDFEKDTIPRADRALYKAKRTGKNKIEVAKK